MKICFTLLFLMWASIANAQFNGCNAGFCYIASSFNGQLNLDLVNNTGNISPAVALTETRAANANVQNTSGGLSSIAANTLRLGADEILNQSSGAWIEEAATNVISSPDFSGAIAPSTLPTGWGRGFYDGSGLTVTINSVSSSSMTFTINGVGSGNYFSLEFMPQLQQAVAIGQQWTCSAMMQVSNITGISKVGLGVVEYTAANTLGTFTVSPIQTVSNDIPWFAQTNQTMTANDHAVCSIAFQTDASGTINSQITITRPQFEQRPWRSTFTTSTRNADIVALASSYQSNYLSSLARSICIGFDAPRYLASGTIWSEFKDTNNYIELRTSGSQTASNLSLFVKSGGSTIANTVLAILPPLSRNIACMSMSPTSIITSINGDPSLTTSVTIPTGLTLANLLSGQNGYGNTTVQNLKTWLFALSSAETISNSSLNNSLFDDFNRTNNSSLGVAPTGQTWAQSGTPVYTINNKFMTTDLTNGAAYAFLSIGKQPVYMGSVQTFTNQTSNGSAALVAATDTPPNSSLPGFTALHNFNQTTDDLFEYIAAGSITPVGQFTFSIPVVKDGSSLSGYGWFARYFDTSIVELTPYGAMPRVKNSLLTSNAGSILWFEAFGGGTVSVPSYRAVSAR